MNLGYVLHGWHDFLHLLSLSKEGWSFRLWRQSKKDEWWDWHRAIEENMEHHFYSAVMSCSNYHEVIINMMSLLVDVDVVRRMRKECSVMSDYWRVASRVNWGARVEVLCFQQQKVCSRQIADGYDVGLGPAFHDSRDVLDLWAGRWHQHVENFLQCFPGNRSYWKERVCWT